MNKKTKRKSDPPSPSNGIEVSEVTQHSPIILIVILVWVTGIFATGINGIFVLDDREFLQNKNFEDFFSFGWLFSAYRPVGNITLAFNLSFFGAEPWSFHVVNILIHVLATASMYYLTSRSLQLSLLSESPDRARLIGLFSAALWGLHPLCTAAVTYIVQRYESLASLFMMLCLICWLRAFGEIRDGEIRDRDDAADKSAIPKWLWAIGAVAAAYLAYGSKQMSAGLPLIVLLFDRVLIAGSWSFLKTRWYWYLLLFLPLVAGAWLVVPQLMNPSAAATAGFSLPGISSTDYFLTQPYVFLQYLKLSLIPYPQSLDYGWLPVEWTWLRVGGALLWTLYLGLGVYLWNRARPVAVCFFSGLLVLAPSSTFLAFQDIIFEHRMYLPLGFLIAATVTWFTGVHGRSDQIASWKILVIVILAMVLSVLSALRNMEYSSAESIFSADLRNNPGNPRAWYSMESAVPRDQVDVRIRYLRQAISLSNKRGYFYAGTDYKWPRDLADILFLSGRIPEAKQIYEGLVDKSYDQLQKAEIYFQLAIIASLEGEDDRAEKFFQLALDSPPSLRQHVQTVYDEYQLRKKRPSPKQ